MLLLLLSLSLLTYYFTISFLASIYVPSIFSNFLKPFLLRDGTVEEQTFPFTEAIGTCIEKVEPTMDPSLSNTAGKQLAVQLMYLTTHQFDEIYIKVIQIVISVSPLTVYWTINKKPKEFVNLQGYGNVIDRIGISFVKDVRSPESSTDAISEQNCRKFWKCGFLVGHLNERLFEYTFHILEQNRKTSWTNGLFHRHHTMRQDRDYLQQTESIRLSKALEYVFSDPSPKHVFADIQKKLVSSSRACARQLDISFVETRIINNIMGIISSNTWLRS